MGYAPFWSTWEAFGFGPNLVRQEPIWSPEASRAFFLGVGSTQGGGQPLLEAAGIEPVNKAIENPKQDALLPAIALILLGFVIPPRPTPCPRVPPLSPLVGHTGGTRRGALGLVVSVGASR